MHGTDIDMTGWTEDDLDSYMLNSERAFYESEEEAEMDNEEDYCPF